uniref:Monodehydroascorbate reductase n=1 Tax=Tanacetum cinerariifolium TaxID=118510 RepID=A0A6L2L7W0_TANCI|nr:hypothetical protein [Tanacetum cinerariifolium]
MDTRIDQQVAMDEALVPHARRLRIGRSNFRLLSDISSKKSTLQLVYDVLHMSSFFNAFLVTTDVLKIYMQEFWVTATVHHHSIWFKMKNNKHIVNLESFREMLHICPRLHGQSFVEPPFKDEIIAFLHFLIHSGTIRRLTDVNINKLHQPWRSFAAIINKCLTGNSLGYDSLRLSQAQILLGLYHKRNVDFAYLMWEDFVYQVEYKDTKKSNEMYYLRFTKVIIHHFMSKDPSIPRRNKFGALLPIELTNAYIKNSDAYKEYYEVATGATTPKPKASVQKTRSSSDTTVTPPLTAVAGPSLTTSEKGKQAAKASKAKSLSALSEVAMIEAQQLKLATKRSLKQTHISQAIGSGADERTSTIPWVSNVPTDECEKEISWKSTDEEGDDDEGNDGDDGNDEDDEEEGSNDEQAFDKQEFIHSSLSTHVAEETRDEESFDPIPKTPKNTIDVGNGEENLGTNIGREEGHDEEEEEEELYRDVNINLGRGIQTTQEFKDSHVTLTPVNPYGQQQSSSVSSQFVTKNDEFLKTIDENMQKIIKEQVKEQVMVQVSKILLKIEQTVNEQLEAEVLTRSSNSSKTSYAVVADLSEMELKKILIKKMEGNKSIHRSNEQRNLYKALIEAYESDKIILDTYGDTVTLKRRRDDDADKNEEPSDGSDRDPRDVEKKMSLSQQPLQGRKLLGALASQHKGLNLDKRRQANGYSRGLLRFPDESAQDWIYPEGQQYPHNLLKPLPLILNTQGRSVIPFDHFINNDLEYLRGGASSRKYTNSVTKTKGISHWGRKSQQFYGFVVNQESARDVYSKRRIIVVTELKIVEWHNYKHLDWIMVRRDDDKLYKFKEGDFKKLCIQDIEDMRVEDLQLGVESYQKKLNLTRPDTYRSDLKHKEAYSAYSNPRGFIYQNKDKENRLMRIDELHKSSDGTLIDVRTALDDRLKGIRMKYLPKSIWRKSDKDRTTAMIQAIDKMLKTMRIIRSLERFVGGRLYEGDFRMLQRTI